MVCVWHNQVGCSPALVMSLDWPETNRVKWSTSPLHTVRMDITWIADNAVTFQGYTLLNFGIKRLSLKTLTVF